MDSKKQNSFKKSNWLCMLKYVPNQNVKMICEIHFLVIKLICFVISQYIYLKAFMCNKDTLKRLHTTTASRVFQNPLF